MATTAPVVLMAEWHCCHMEANIETFPGSNANVSTIQRHKLETCKADHWAVVARVGAMGTCPWMFSGSSGGGGWIESMLDSLRERLNSTKPSAWFGTMAR